MYVPIKKCEQRGKAVIIEDIMHTADGGGNGDTKVAQKKPKKQKSEPANAKLRTKRKKEPNRKRKGVRVEGTTKVASQPRREKDVRDD